MKIISQFPSNHSHFNMDELRDDAEYAVFDDISGGFKFFPNYKGWLGCQAEFTVTDKYRAKKKIQVGANRPLC